jgi:hypothetical protein
MGRMLECATWLALWQRVAPDSSQRASELARWSASKNGQRMLTPANLALLASLFPGAPRPEPGTAVPLATVLEATEGFLRHYTHAAPFDRGVIEALWRHCDGPGCSERRRRAERVLGPFGASAGLAHDAHRDASG